MLVLSSLLVFAVFINRAVIHLADSYQVALSVLLRMSCLVIVAVLCS